MKKHVFILLFWIMTPILSGHQIFSQEAKKHLGHVIADREVDIKPELSGRLKSILVKQGADVKKGQPLAQLDDQMQQAVARSARMRAAYTSAVDRAKLQVEQFKVRLDRLVKLKEKGIGSTTEQLEDAQFAYDDAKLQLKTAEEELELAKVNMDLELARLKQYEINAAFDGRIREIYTAAGASVIPDEPVLKIVDLNPLKAVIHLPSPLLTKLQHGKVYDLELGMPVNRTVSAKLTFIDPGHNSASGTVRCHFEIDNKNFELPYGISVWLKM